VRIAYLAWIRVCLIWGHHRTSPSALRSKRSARLIGAIRYTFAGAILVRGAALTAVSACPRNLLAGLALVGA
jgi:hypothetical protein